MRAKVLAIILMGSVFLVGLGSGTGEGAPPKFISLATGGTGGTYYVIGGGMGKVIEKYIPGVKISVESTAASTENCRLVASQKVQFAIVMPDSAYFAYKGGREFGEKK